MNFGATKELNYTTVTEDAEHDELNLDLTTHLSRHYDSDHSVTDIFYYYGFQGSICVLTAL
jgi:hypothetical protein